MKLVRILCKTAAIALFSITVISVSPLHGDTTAGETHEFARVFGFARAELLRGNYLTAIKLVQPFALSGSSSGSQTIRDPHAFQVWNQMQAMVSGRPSELKLDEIDSFDREMITAVTESTAEAALSAIVDRARSTRIVILNENHVTPCQRAFAEKVAERLRPLGYDTLALEALATVPVNNAVELRNRGYALYGDGFYTRDPVFSTFIRRSLQLGYTPLAYEHNTSNGTAPHSADLRERGQAENLNRFLLKHPQAKLLVYSGGSHLAEQPLEDGSKMMGQWLKELSGIDPLTIDQNRLQPTTATRRHLIKKNIPSDTVLFYRNAPLVVGGLAGRVDMQILPASPQYISGRPRCLLGREGQVQQYSLKKYSKTGVFLLQAFGLSDENSAAPLDQVVVNPGALEVSLVLPRIPVRIVMNDR